MSLNFIDCQCKMFYTMNTSQAIMCVTSEAVMKKVKCL